MRQNSFARSVQLAAKAHFLLMFLLLPLGAFARVPEAQPSRPLRVVRYFDSGRQLHAFTIDGEGGAQLPATFQRESVAEGTPDSPFFYLATTQYPGMVALYRFQGTDGSQRFALSAEERAALSSQGFEEIAKPVFVYSVPVEGASEIFRLKNPGNGDLLYTTSRAEKTYLTGLGWAQQSSVGYTQSTSSGGTGILWPTTVKLEDADMALLASPAGDGSRLVFSSTNDKLAKLAVGAMLYAPVEIGRDAEGRQFFRAGFMRKATHVERQGAGLVVETAQAGYKDLFHDVHLFLDNRPAVFPSKSTGAPMRSLPEASEAASLPVARSFDGLTDYRQPEYLSQMVRPVPEDASGGSVGFNQNLSYSLGDGGANAINLSGNLQAELTGEVDYSAGCSDSIDLGFLGSICDQYTVSGTVLITPSASVSAMAVVNTGSSYSIEKPVLEESETFEVEGIPITVTFTLNLGASIDSQATATFSASAQARGTGGFSASLVAPEVWDSSGSLIACPNPCPPGFSCGSSDQGYAGSGPTCSASATAGDTINLNAGAIDAQVWVRPDIAAGPGLDDLSASIDFSLKNAIDFNISSTAVTGTYELTPAVGYDAGLCVWGYNLGYSGSTNLAQLDVPIFSAGLPSASTEPPSTFTTSSALLSGTATPNNLPSTAYFLYGTSSSLSGASQTATQSCSAAQTSCFIQTGLSGLQSGKTYYSQLVVQNLLGTMKGEIMSFIVPAAQTITFPNPGTQTYGVAPFALKATASSGLPITYYVTSGFAMVNGSTLTITGSGPITLTATQPGNANFVAATPVEVTFQVNAEAGSFGSVAIGTTSPSVPVNFTLASGSKVGSVAALTLGAATSDYKVSQMTESGTTFTVNATFSPQAPGARPGSVVVYDTSKPAKILATVPLSGIGVGPQIQFENNKSIDTLGSGFNGPFGVAVDGSGNVYVAEYPANGVGYGDFKEIVAAGGYTTVNTIVAQNAGLLRPNGVAVDGAGNLFIADKRYNYAVEILAPGYTTMTSLQSLLHPQGIAIDLKGNVFVTVQGDNSVVEIPAAGGYSTVNTLITGLNSPDGIAIDASGNLYVADTGNNAVKEFIAPAYTKVQILGSGFSAPAGVAVDAAGNVYVADTGHNAVKEMLAAGGYTTIQTLGSGFSAPNGVAVDASGNVYVADTGNNAVKKLDFSDWPVLSFAATKVNAVSTDSPFTLTIANEGNAPLTFPFNPILPSGFPVSSASTCPALIDEGSAGTLAAGATCSFILSFSPVEPGEVSSTLVLTDNTLNAASPGYASQYLEFSGTGLFPALLTATVTAANKTYDGTTAAVATSCSLSGVLPSDTGQVSCSTGSASFASAGVGNGVAVSVPVMLTGPAAARYVLSSAAATTTASIAPAILTVTPANLMMPVGGTVPATSFTYSGFVNGQGTSVVTTAPKCTTSATSQSIQGNYPIVCSGGVATNYIFQYATGTLTVSLGAQFVTTEYSVGTGLSSSAGVAVDANSNIYVADTGNNAIKEIQVGNGYSIATIATGFSSPSGVAVDSSGNLYVADTGNNAVKQILAAGGYKTVKTLGAGFKSPNAVAVDAGGNVYVADTGNNAVKEILAAGGYTTVKALGSGFLKPTGVAVDAHEDVFVADNGNNAVKEIVLAGGYRTVNTLGSGLSQPYGVALDNNGNLYVTDTGNGAVKELMAPAFVSVTTLASGFSAAKGLAVDLTGNVYVAPGGASPVQVIAYAPCFPTIPVGTTSLKYSYYFTFLLGGSIGTPAISTQGATGQEFSDAGTGSCTKNGASHVYNPGDSCSVDVTFQPAHPGPRLGAVQLTNAKGALVATALLSGTGTAPQVAFPSNTAGTALGSGLSGPNAVAVASNGNLFVADTKNNAVKEILATGGYATVKALGSGFSAPSAVAVDGDGNVYVADTGNNAVKEILAIGGYTTVRTLGGSFPAPAGIAVDGAGNVFVSARGNATVYEILWGGLVTTLKSSFSSPGGLAVDTHSNVFVADTGDNAVKEIPAAGGYTTVQTLGSGFSAPAGVAVEASGNIFVADTGNSAVKEILAAGGYATVVDIESGLSGPTGVALDESGNLFLSLSGAASALELPLSKTPALSFASTAIGKSSTAQTITLENNGNATLLPIFSGTAAVPAISAGFTITGGTCMITKGSSWLAPGASCTVSVAFTPQTGQTGKVSGTLTFTDNHLNLNPATQSIALTGTVATP
jgi:sugar lactone lactonase YvrE